jgi:hypothetical protein
MPVRDINGDLSTNMSDCWFPAYLNPRWSALTPKEQADVTAFINAVFDAAAKTPPHRFNFTDSFPSDWRGSVLQPIYEKCAQYDETDAARILGNAFCRVGVSRPELWLCHQQLVGDHTSRSYILSKSGTFP